MAKKLPETLYGCWIDDPNGKPEDSYVRTAENPDELIEIGDSKRVGVYKFAGYVDVFNVTTLTPAQEKKRK